MRLPALARKGRRWLRRYRRSPGRPLLAAILLAVAVAPASAEPIRISSKNATESYLLAEIAAQALEARGFVIDRRFGLGGTLIAFEAVSAGEIDLYMEYTGTLSRAIFELGREPSRSELNHMLAPRGLRLLSPFGFNNTYALALPRPLANRLSLTRISDLADHPNLKAAFSHEFLERDDGWPGLSEVYGLRHEVSGIEHGLSYQAIADGAIDITDAYSTDGELQRYDLTLLSDDLGYFPEYLAAPLIRTDLDPVAQRVLNGLGGSLDDSAMQRLNAAVVEGATFATVAARFLAGRTPPAPRELVRGRPSLPEAAPKAEETPPQDRLWSNLATNTLQHLKLTGIALGAAVAAGLALSLAIFRKALVSRSVIYACGLMQTIPSIALLALMIPLFGIGVKPAIAALFLYSLLPILRNAITALTTIEPTLLQVAQAMGLTRWEQIRHVYLPLAMPSVLAGIRTAAVINIGTATLAAFIGAGGLGDPIVTGLSLNNVNLILQGAIPAAVLAVLTELLFEAVERFLVPGHLRSR